MERNIILKTNKGHFGYFENLQDALKDAYPYTFYGGVFFVYIINKNGIIEPYYYKDNIALSIHKNNIEQLIKDYKVNL